VIVDVTTVPALRRSYDTAGYAKGVAVSGDYAYVANGSNGLVIVDVSSKSAPALAGSYDTVGSAQGVAVSGDYAYVADGVNGLVILRMDAVLTPLKGDLNSDDALTPTDAAIALQIAVGSRPCDAAMLAAADVSGDGSVTSLDALMILQAAAGAIGL